MSVQPSFSGEIQFRRYSDTSTQGQQVVFAVADREALANFIGKEGKRFMAVLVEIGDDELPVQPPTPRKDTRGPMCKEAQDYCALPGFWEWVTQTCPNYGPVFGEATARLWVLDTCQISTRMELDTDRQAADDFIKYVRIPFMKWQRERKA